MEIDRETAELVYQTASRLESEMLSFSEAGRRIARRTVLIVRSVIALLGIVAIVIFFLIADLTNNLEDALANMVDMYERFETMSADMDIITASVRNISDNVEGLPTIATKMQTINRGVGSMRANVRTMTGNIVQMDQSMLMLKLGVHAMANRFEHLNITVHNMRFNVNQMSGPVRRMGLSRR
jgi:predicted PurR-regulated permease PerM